MPQTLEEFVRGTPFERELERLREVEKRAQAVLRVLDGLSTFPGATAAVAAQTLSVRELRKAVG
jgi:hypothetical protein